MNVDSSSLPLQDINGLCDVICFDFFNLITDFLCVSLQIGVGEKVLKFYWFDAYEDRLKQPGILKHSSPWEWEGNSNLSTYW